MKKNLYIGLMSGTSIDAIDAVLLQIFPNKKLPAKIEIINACSTPINQNLKNEILTLCTSGENELDRMAKLDRKLGLLFGQCALDLCKLTDIPPSDITAIGSHGQTIRHSPVSSPTYSIQIADPNTIAEISKITTIADFRRRDIAAGGQGAPLVPAFHKAAFSSTQTHRAIINLGGIANISILPNVDENISTCTGYDIGPANLLMDYWIGLHKGERFDNEGAWALSGEINQSLLAHLLADPFFKAPPPKSSGREYFNADWLHAKIKSTKLRIPAEDIQATLLELTAECIRIAVQESKIKIVEIYLCGGGTKNKAIIERLKAKHSDIKIETTEVLGMNPQFVEGAAFAWFAYQTFHRLTSNEPNATGAKDKRILGGIYYA
jgi:anhydro-N-acetylmuramic acid kinase